MRNAWRVSVEIPPTAHDLDVTLQYSTDEPEQIAMNNAVSATMTRRTDLGVRNVFEFTIPGSENLTVGHHFDFRVFIRYALPGRVKNKFFIGQTHRVEIPINFGF